MQFFTGQRAVVPVLRNDSSPNATASNKGKGKPSQALFITSVFSDITFNFELHSIQ